MALGRLPAAGRTPRRGVERAEWPGSGSRSIRRSDQFAFREPIANVGRLRKIHHSDGLRECTWRVGDGDEQMCAEALIVDKRDGKDGKDGEGATVEPGGEDRVDPPAGRALYEGRGHYCSRDGEQEGQPRRARLGHSHGSVLHQPGGTYAPSEPTARARAGQAPPSGHGAAARPRSGPARPGGLRAHDPAVG